MARNFCYAYSCLLFTEIQPFDCIKKILPRSTYTSRNPSLSAFRISYSPGRTESLLMGKLSSITLAISAISTIPQNSLLGYRFIYCVLAPGDIFVPAANFPAVTMHKSAGEAISSSLHGLPGGKHHREDTTPEPEATQNSRNSA